MGTITVSTMGVGACSTVAGAISAGTITVSTMGVGAC